MVIYLPGRLICALHRRLHVMVSRSSNEKCTLISYLYYSINFDEIGRGECNGVNVLHFIKINFIYK